MQNAFQDTTTTAIVVAKAAILVLEYRRTKCIELDGAQ